MANEGMQAATKGVDIASSTAQQAMTAGTSIAADVIITAILEFFHFLNF